MPDQKIYKDSYIVHERKTLPVKLQNGTNIQEDIFILDKNKNIIQKSGFLCKYQIKNKPFTGGETIHIKEDCFLFYSNNQEEAYAHYMNEVLERLYVLNNDLSKTIKILIPIKFYNNMIEFFKKSNCFLFNNDIIIIDYDNLYFCKNLITLQQSVNFSILTDKRIESINLIREKLHITKNILKKRLVYLKRDTLVTTETNCYNIGRKREIINLIELEKCFNILGFETVILGDKQILDKKNHLMDAKIVISMYGGNLWNFIFSNSPENLIVLSSKNNHPYLDYIKSILNNKKVLYSSDCKVKTFCYNTEYNKDINNIQNGCFFVDIQEIRSYILETIHDK